MERHRGRGGGTRDPARQALSSAPAPKGLDPLLDLARRIARLGAWFGGLLIIASALLVGVEVVIRKAFDLTIGGADELSGFALAISTSWALAFALLERAHIRIDSLYVHLPARLAAVLDLLGLALFTAFVALVTWYGFGVFETSSAVGAHSLSPLGTPLVVPQLLWVLGFVMFLLIAALLLVRALAALVTGDLQTVRRLIGSRGVSEELESELADLKGDGLAQPPPARPATRP
jgi:TRAP-type mannitol/chloroaromatic compound transport system permease small subunit